MLQARLTRETAGYKPHLCVLRSNITFLATTICSLKIHFSESNIRPVDIPRRDSADVFNAAGIQCEIL